MTTIDYIKHSTGTGLELRVLQNALNMILCERPVN